MKNLANALSNKDIDDRVNVIMERLCLNLSTSVKTVKEIKPLLTSIKKAITEYDDSILDFSLLLSILDCVISLCPFEDVLDVFSVEDLTYALKSQIAGLVKSACKVIGAARPKDIFAGSAVLDEMLVVFFNISTDVDVINEIEKILPILMTDELNRRRLLENNIPTLLDAKRIEESSVFCRLLDLLVILFENISFEEFREDLFIVDSDMITKAVEEDILVFIHVCKYYTHLLVILRSSADKKWSLRYLRHVFSSLGECFAKRHDYEDVEHFGRTYLLQFFSEISYLEDFNVFMELEERYFPFSGEHPDMSEFLTVINPAYFSKYHENIVKNLKLSPRNIEVYRNLLRDETCFELLKDSIISSELLSMPYLEQLYFLEALTAHSYGIHHLTHEMSMVMNDIINKNATERTCFKLRLKVFENLLEANPQELSIWLIPLQSEYTNIMNGKPTQSRGHSIANDYL